MRLASGDRLGPYEVISPLGKGGMGEVYRAKDSRLGRDVALKVLPPDVSADSSFRERFEREARMVSALNHPNICTLFDIGRENHNDYIVMELLEGETLADRLARGRLTVGQAMRIGAQICGALGAAHRRGIVHRDLKPANVMIAANGVKLLDFGLAKPVITAEDKTRSLDLTSEGMVVGTLYYMAPEQLEGKALDFRADLFAFGCVLYEMLSGKRAFTGDSHASVITAILSGARPVLPDLDSLHQPWLEHLMYSCLERDPEMRRHSARDLQRDLEFLLRQEPKPVPAAGSPPASPAEARQAWWKTAAAACVLLATTGWAAAFWPRQAPSESLVYSLEAPAGTQIVPDHALTGGSQVSPDGKWLAFTATSEGKTNLWIRRVDSLESQMVAGSEGAYSPFWSPDSESIGFFALGALRRAERGGGARTLAQTPAGDGGTWNSAGVIVFSRAATGGLYQVTAQGGEPQPLTTLDSARGEFSHTWAQFLPDQSHFLYSALSTNPENDRLMVGSLNRNEPPKPLLNLRSHVSYTRGPAALLPKPGILLYVRGTDLVAHPFDADKLAFAGEPAVVEGAAGTSDFSASGNGILVLGAANRKPGQVVWKDREGKTTGRVTEPGLDGYPALSPDGRGLALARANLRTNSMDLWTLDLDRNTSSRVTFEPGLDAFPVWSAGGKAILYSSSRSGLFQVHMQDPNGVDNGKRIGQATAHRLTWDWSNDDAFALISELTSEGKWVLRKMAIPDGASTPLTNPAFNAYHGQFSPDGAWISFTSDRKGRDDVYLQSLQPGGERFAVSADGGSSARWRPDGKELYYVAPNGDLMAVPVRLSSTKPEIGAPQALFRINAPPGLNFAFPYDIAQAGQRFLVLDRAGDAARFIVLRGWKTR
ncbi:MAG: serine/threonine-protein kinase [Bryobacteraceae bacterium]|nr:serine/threonine-protein kinase [Bryobacteraceae bacterium]